MIKVGRCRNFHSKNGFVSYEQCNGTFYQDFTGFWIAWSSIRNKLVIAYGRNAKQAKHRLLKLINHNNHYHRINIYEKP